ncbi:MAG: RNA pyrophosphohydrolase [Alphaproteobacteria bacterium]|nr:RNA pyrophosphohydrolase [Alphaproteobacteria bacterium]MBU1278163.1 RNA pyrophosphohydrolase [Alphaproteobacteria bacterium]MBU1574022.1 RNA pyrophosphohydrolase [Alphaproteobacteria bacterium]MBU1829839.1 RNA pyrophosphohydrolase [Alphaproteobacteria bacterium]MBU2077246.1 RNA pyrophosphohydrolase [Alphaproteobacteria bacterium]
MTKDLSTLPYRPCVGIMLLNAEGRIFVGERIDTPGAWQMPQGGIDAGETPEEAALRELWEEIGVNSDHVEVLAQSADWLTYDLPDHLLGKVWKGKYRGQKQLWFVLRFKGAESAINIDTDHPEFAQWKWTDSAGLVSDIVSFKRDIYQALVTEFSGHLA